MTIYDHVHAEARFREAAGAELRARRAADVRTNLPTPQECVERFDLAADARETRDAAMRKIRLEFQRYIETWLRCPKCGGREAPGIYWCNTCETSTALGDRLVLLVHSPYTAPPEST